MKIRQLDNVKFVDIAEDVINKFINKILMSAYGYAC